MMSQTASRDRDAVKDKVRELAHRCAGHARPDAGRASIQLATTLLPLIATVALMFAAVGDAYWVVLLLALPAAGLVVRLFVMLARSTLREKL